MTRRLSLAAPKDPTQAGTSWQDGHHPCGLLRLYLRTLLPSRRRLPRPHPSPPCLGTTRVMSRVCCGTAEAPTCLRLSRRAKPPLTGPPQGHRTSTLIHARRHRCSSLNSVTGPLQGHRASHVLNQPTSVPIASSSLQVFVSSSNHKRSLSQVALFRSRPPNVNKCLLT